MLRTSPLLAFALLALTATSAAQDVSEAAANEPQASTSGVPDDTLTPTQGRGFSWGGAAVIPMMLGDVRYAESDMLVPYYTPGGGVMGRVGIELPYGLALYGIFSLHASSVEAETALTLYRGAVELRYTIDTGVPVLPVFGVGADLLFYIRDQSLGTTGGMHANAGIAFAVAWWAQLEVIVELDVAFPGAAFRDTVLTLMPSVGGTFFF